MRAGLGLKSEIIELIDIASKNMRPALVKDLEAILHTINAEDRKRKQRSKSHLTAEIVPIRGNSEPYGLRQKRPT